MLPRSTLEQWAVLAAVVDHGGFAQAASALHRSQSSVSYSIAQLQSAIDLPLLAIEGRRSVLTAHGQTLLKRARGLIADWELLEKVGRSLSRGWEPVLHLVVDAAYPRAGLLEILAELSVSCPDTQLQLSDVVLSGAEEAISEGAADLVITSKVPPNYLGDWLIDVTFVAAARSDHPLFQLGRSVVTEDLKKHVQAVVRDSGSTRPRDEGWLGAERRFTVSSMEASLAMLLAGLAYAWLPEHVLADSLQRGALQRLPLTAGAERIVSLHQVVLHPESLGPATRMAMAAFSNRRIVLTSDAAEPPTADARVGD